MCRCSSVRDGWDERDDGARGDKWVACENGAAVGRLCRDADANNTVLAAVHAICECNTTYRDVGTEVDFEPVVGITRRRICSMRERRCVAVDQVFDREVRMQRARCNNGVWRNEFIASQVAHTDLGDVNDP